MSETKRYCHNCRQLVEPQPVVLFGVDRTWSPPAQGMGTLVPKMDNHGIGIAKPLTHAEMNNGFGYCPICGAKLVW